jgi:hypothetical protein
MSTPQSGEPPRSDISRLYCEVCDKFQPVRFDAPDIVCKECGFVIATADVEVK